MFYEASGGHKNGLSDKEAARRMQQYGSNTVPEPLPKPGWWRFFQQFKSPLIYILLFALVLDLFFWGREGAKGIPIESIAIALILLLNAGLGVWQEGKAEAALDKLKQLSSPQVWVLREGKWQQLAALQLVPGDLVRLEAGDRIPADGVALQLWSPLVDESMLTGESLPVQKAKNEEFFSGTLLVRGRIYLEITRTGRESALGKLATLLEGIKAESTPLERRLESFGSGIARWVLLLAGVLMLAGVLVEGTARIAEVFVFAVALAVAAVPEGLPAILTFTLALGVERMAKRKTVVRKLSAVEALGSVTVIATDKTGTLTENQMSVRHLDSPAVERALRTMVLANDAEEGVGDPLEVALLDYARRQGQDPTTLITASPRLSSLPFDSAWKYMRVTVKENGVPYSYFKGAPEVLLPKTNLPQEEQAAWGEKALAYATEGFRVLGLASRPGEEEEGLDFLGLVLFWDPPRAEIPQAIRSAQAAGIRVLMVTGDHPATALAVARQIGIPGQRVLTGEDLQTYEARTLARALEEVNVFARVRPEQKLLLVEALQAQGEIVAMTGDGVNDAPALKRSDVGIAMGQRGSAVSREVADLVLLDDNFATIVAAIEEGRSIYENIQKFIRFLFATNLAEVLVVALGAFMAYILGLRNEAGALLLPLVAVQILWINLVTDGLPALALALDRNPGRMQLPPRLPQAPLLDNIALRFVVTTGVLSALIALGLLAIVPLIGFSLSEARTGVFHFLAIVQFLLVYPARHTQVYPLPNPALHIMVLLGIGLQFLVGMVPAIAQALGSVPLPLVLWGLILVAAFLALFLTQVATQVFWGQRARA
ncbi:MAG: cation-transporting P-type ATPase [Thermaceae bacterium]|nr:cation-transporting P-type ATPase [Thermaceae bacterium]